VSRESLPAAKTSMPKLSRGTCYLSFWWYRVRGLCLS